MAKFATVNVLAADGAGSIIFNIQQTLVAAGWTVQKSSDGTTYKSTPGSQITASGAGAGGANNNNAWILLQDPGGRRQFVIQRGTATTQIRAAYSALAKFTGGTPNATTLPTATDQAFVIGTSGAFSTTLPAAGLYYTHCIAQSTPVGNVYGFWMLNTATGTGATTSSGLLCCEPLATGSFPAADVDPVVIFARNSGNFFASYWWKYGFGDQTFVNMGSGTYAGAFFIATTGLNGIGGSSTFAGDNPYDGLANNIPVFFGRPASLTQPGWKGWSTYVLTKLSNHAYPDTADLATDAFVYLDISLALPWPNGTVPLT